MTTNTLIIERHYGNKKLETIMGNLVRVRLLSFKLSSDANNNSEYIIGANTTDINNKSNKV